MKMVQVIVAIVAASCFAGCASVKSVFKDDEERVPLSSVPPPVMERAGATLEGFEATRVSREMEHGQDVYELKGKANGEEYELKITADGRIIRLEQEDDDD
ncbi:MAG: PepSY domain-containing protein [Planctomycetota bacterium]